MSRAVLFSLVAAAIVFAADDPWTKVKEIKSGSEIRVVKRGSLEPIVAKMDEATDDRLSMVVKNEQVAVPREQIDRVDVRPQKSRVTTETKSKLADADTRPGPMGRGGSGTPTTTYSSGVNIGSKPEFETVYRRPVPASKPTQPK